MQATNHNHDQHTRAAVMTADDEILTTAESFLLLAALCTLATSIFSFSLI